MLKFLGVDPSRVLFLRFDLISQRTTYPTRLRDILPYGAEGTIRGLFAWFKVDIGEVNRAALLQIAASMIMCTMPTILPYVMTSRTLFVSGIIDTLNTAERQLASASASGRLRNLHVDMATMILRNCAIVLNLAVQRCNEVQRRLFLKQHVHDLVAATDRCTSPEPGSWVSRQGQEGDNAGV
jgi:hypothetical protein